MDIESLKVSARRTRALYERYEVQQYGRAWSTTELALGFMGDVGDLAKLIQGTEGVRDTDDLQNKVAHELADCLWSVLVLADRLDVDIEAAWADLETELTGRLEPIVGR